MAPELAAGPLAGCVVWAAHAAIDWDWEMPAATLPAIVLAGALLAIADAVDPGGRRTAGAPVVRRGKRAVEATPPREGATSGA